MFCKVTLIGRISSDIENIKQGLKFSVAHNSTQKGDDGKYETQFVECVCFGKNADNLTQYAGKGDLLYIEGNLQISEYVDRNNNARKSTSILVGMFRILQQSKSNVKPQEQQGQYHQVDASAYKKQGYSKQAKPQQVKQAPAQEVGYEFSENENEMPF